VPCAIIKTQRERNTSPREKETTTMTYTYKTYMLNKDIEKHSNEITILSREQMDLGAIVTFTTNNQRVLDEIFSEE
jgi:hypothetical protein